VDMQFNHVGHLAELLKAQESIDLVLAAHNHLRGLLEDYYEIRPDVATLYVAPAPGHAGAPVDQEPRPEGRLRIGWLGRNSPEKRADLVLQVAAMVPESDFVLAGGGLRRLKADSAHLKNVDIAGWVDSSTDFLAGCDLILNTSDTEGVSLTAMEALQLGVPVVTRDVGGMCELVQDERNGLVYDADDLGSLAQRLRDRELIEGIRARVVAERLPDRFSHEHMITTLTKALHRPKPSRAH
jgi:glycosyltransferase involved in cell wall biosynthesis